MNGNERNYYESSCPRCGGDAQWSFVDQNKTVVEIRCPDCGEYRMPREEFDQVAAENAELTEPDHR